MILDAFAGCGGWDEGLVASGFGDIVGVEWWHDACLSAMNAGHARVRADVATFPVGHLKGKVDGLVMSPPCTDFSLAGKRRLLDGQSGKLIYSVPAWISAIRPRWFACEQVPPAVVYWREFEQEMQELGYKTWVGIINAADFGVPQTRRRAFFVGRRDNQTVRVPSPTHAKAPRPNLFGEELDPWVTMAEALGWGLTDRASFTLMAGHDRWGAKSTRRALTDARTSGTWAVSSTMRVNTRGNSERESDSFDGASMPSRTITAKSDWFIERLSTTIVGSFRPDIVAAPGWRGPGDGPRQNAEGNVQITVREALILQ